MRNTITNTIVGNPTNFQIVLLEARLEDCFGLAIAGGVNNRQWAFNKKQKLYPRIYYTRNSLRKRYSSYAFIFNGFAV